MWSESCVCCLVALSVTRYLEPIPPPPLPEEDPMAEPLAKVLKEDSDSIGQWIFIFRLPEVNSRRVGLGGAAQRNSCSGGRVLDLVLHPHHGGNCGK